MNKYSILIMLGLLALVSCQEELNINRDTLSIPVTKSDDSALTLDSITSSHNSDESELKTKPAPSPSRTSPTKWAVILNGGYCTSDNYKYYWNDCQLVYLTLTQELGYPSNQIYCLISDGIDGSDDRTIGNNNNTDSSPTDLDGDGYRDVYYSASYTDLYSVFNALRYEVSNDDEVLVFVTGPVTFSGNLGLWDPLGWADLSPSSLDSLLDLLGTSVNIDVILGQEKSGLYISSICAENRTIVAAMASDQSVFPDDFYEGNSAFVSEWTNAISNINPSVTGTFSNGDGYLSSFELFKYAEQAILDNSNDQTPKMNNNGPDLFAWGHDLEGNSFVPYFDGPDYAEQTYYGTYTFYGLPSTYSCSWSYSNNLRKISSTGTSVTIAGNLNSSSQIVSFGAEVTAQFTDIGETFSVTKDIESVWKAGQYMNLNYIQGGNGVYYIGGYNWSGPYGYYWECEDPAWQITSQNNNFVYISEGYTSNPVPLMVTFYNPLGGMTYVFDYVND